MTEAVATTSDAGELDWLMPDRTWSVGAGFWQGVQEGELRFPKCDGCGRFAWYPVPRCSQCGSHAFTWTAVDPHGTVHSFTVIRRAFLPEFALRLPLGVVQLRFAEAPGVTLLSTLATSKEVDGLEVGRPARVVFEPSPSGYLFPLTRLGLSS